ncbi:MAG: hypothetical protein JO001_07610 [Alphaproteobacteria bacterium]|nr:hypothetical protein [Alphaproteobacteria bacterium]
MTVDVLSGIFEELQFYGCAFAHGQLSGPPLLRFGVWHDCGFMESTIMAAIILKGAGTALDGLELAVAAAANAYCGMLSLERCHGRRHHRTSARMTQACVGIVELGLRYVRKMNTR